MLDLVKIVAANGVTSITVNDDLYYPVEVFTWHPEWIGEQHGKLKGPGRHASYSEVETLVIQMEGHIKADTTDDYWVRRKALLNVVVPDADQLLPWHGYVQWSPDGDTETYYQKVHLVECEVPMEALYPTVTPFRFEWEGLDGYWLKLSNNLPAKL